MPFDASDHQLDHDFTVLELIGEHIDGLMETVIRGGGPRKTVRRWLVGHRDIPEDGESQVCLMATATDLELFTPSMTGRTQMDRYLDAQRPPTGQEGETLQALRAAQFRLIRIVDRDGPDTVRLKDLVTQEDIVLLNAHISPLAAGAPTAMRLCPLASGRHVLISPMFIIDEAMLAAAMALARPGRPLGHGHRCAANLYRDIARRGFIPMPRLAAPSLEEILTDLSEVQQLALRWLSTDDDDAERTELIAAIRRAADLDLLVDSCRWFADATAGGRDKAKQATASIADVLAETLAQRDRAGVGGCADILDRAAAEIAARIVAGDIGPEARALIERLRARWSKGAPAGEDARRAPDRAELDRVIQLILGLRAKTVDRGCTEQEAMAAAAKVAELLARHDLSMDEVGVRRSDCAGATVETSRRRRAPIDSCVQPVADFCDCRAWSEEADNGTLRYIYFGLKADVEGARFLHDLIENAFETESAAFRSSEIYGALMGGNRRMALNSFQIGLASGITSKLSALKTTRTASAATTTGFDLVAVKHSVVDEEVERLGLRFVSKSASGRRKVHGDAYALGKAVGAQFEPHPSIA